jgi:hypothetical protein
MTTIPIPRDDEGVEIILDALRSDEATVSETDPDELETQINNIVYDMFDIPPNQQDVIEDYLQTFRVY